MTDSHPIPDQTDPSAATGLQLTFPVADSSVAVVPRLFTAALVLITTYFAYFRLEQSLLSIPTFFLLCVVAAHLWSEWAGRRTIEAIEIMPEGLVLDWGKKQRSLRWEEIDQAGYASKIKGYLLIILCINSGPSPKKLKFVVPPLALYGEPARKPVLDELARYVPVCRRFR